jgi:hypothetical protein
VKEKSKNIFEDSKEGTIGARIKVLLPKYDNNVSALEEAGKIGNGTLKTWKDKSLDYSTTILLNFRKELRINPEWWDTGKGEVFVKNGTYVDIPNEKPQNGMTIRETFYQELIENNAEYSLLPRAVLRDYKIVPDKIIDVILKSNEHEREAMEKSSRLEIESLNQKYELIIAGLENKSERLEKENIELKKQNEDLRRQIPANSQ